MKNYTTSSLNQVKRGAKRASYDIATIHQILDDTFIGYIGYTYNNTVITLPMAYGRIDDKIYLHGALKNRLLNDLIQQKQVSMTVMILDGLVLARSGLHHSANYRSATIFCSVNRIDDPVVKTKALESVVNHMIPNRWETLRPMLQKELDATLVVELCIETASAKIRAGDVADDKQDLDLPIWAGVVPVKQSLMPPINDPLLPLGVEVPPHIQALYTPDVNS